MIKKVFIILSLIYFSLNLYPTELIVGSEISYPPYTMLDSDKKPIGFSIDLIEETLKIMNIDYTFKINTWNEIKNELSQGSIDILPVVGRTEDRDKIFDFSIPYLTMHGALTIRKGDVKPMSLDELKGKSIAVMKGDNAESYLINSNVDLNIITTKTYEESFTLLANGGVDAVLSQRYLAYKIIEDQLLTNLEINNDFVTDFKQTFSFAVKEGNTELLQLLNEGLSTLMVNGFFDIIQEKWFTSRSKLRNTKDLIIVGGDNNYPPYEYIDKNGEPAGYNVDLTKAIAKEMGLNIHIDLKSWSTVYNQLYSGEIDILQGVFYSSKGEKELSFSQPHNIIKHVVVQHKKDKNIYTPADLFNLKIIVMKDDIMESYILEKQNNNTIVFAKNYEDALDKLSQGLGECALLAKTPAEYWIKENKIRNLKVGNIPIFTPEYNYATVKNNNHILISFKEGLSIVTNNGTQREIYNKWLGEYESQGIISKKVLFDIAVFILLPLFIIALLVLFWLRSLKSEINKRTLELKRSEQKLSYIIESTTAFIFIVDFTGRIVINNKILIESFNLDKVDIIGKKYTILPFLRDIDLSDIFFKNLNEENYFDYKIIKEQSYIDINNNKRWLQVTLKPLENYVFGSPVVIGTAADITDLIKQQQINNELQQQLLHKSKMDAVGQLAGGIAHDFNNILSGIVNASTLINKTNLEKKDLHYIDIIQKSSSHASSLISKLLSFSGTNHDIESKINIEDLISDTIDILKETLNKSVTIIVKLLANKTIVIGNISSLQSSIINLCINSAHAMNNNGELTITTSNITISPTECNRKDFNISPGTFIKIQIIDNGTGISDENKKRIFEPFFTTKKLGEGTGLGLSAVYTAVINSKGFIEVDSTIGVGTTFSLFLPVTNQQKPPRKSNTKTLQKGSGLILFVDDEEINRELGHDILESLGYSVILAKDGIEAINIYSQKQDIIDLIILDFMMPKMNGKETFIKLREINPDLKIILSSGYSDSDDIDFLKNNGLTGLIAKPYTLSDMSMLIKKTLE